MKEAAREDRRLDLAERAVASLLGWSSSPQDRAVPSPSRLRCPRV